MPRGAPAPAPAAIPAAGGAAAAAKLVADTEAQQRAAKGQSAPAQSPGVVAGPVSLRPAPSAPFRQGADGAGGTDRPRAMREREADREGLAEQQVLAIRAAAPQPKPGRAVVLPHLEDGAAAARPGDLTLPGWISCLKSVCALVELRGLTAILPSEDLHRVAEFVHFWGEVVGDNPE